MPAETKPDPYKRVIPPSRILGAPTTPPLKHKQEAFVREVAVDGNAKRAAIAAGYSEKTAAEMGYENLKKPHVAQAVQIYRKSAAEEAGIKAVSVLRIALHHATYDPAMLVDDEGDPIPLKKLPPEMRAVIQGVDIVAGQNGYSYRYRLVPKDGALEKLFRHLGLFEKDNAQQSEGGVRALMQAVQAQANRVPIKP